MQPYTHITLEEREKLYLMMREGKRIREIARLLGRSASSVSRELRRNSGNETEEYTPLMASVLYIERRRKCRKKRRCDDETLRAYIQEKLNAFWSPEMICEKWKQAHANEKLSHSTVYRAIKSGAIPECSEQKHLLRRGRRKYNHGSLSQPIKAEHNIRERPEEATGRLREGDWEVDTIRGSRENKGNLLIAVDRKSRYVRLSLLPRRTATATAAAVCATLEGLPVHSITMDNGGEFANYKDIERKLNVTVYFADPHAPWQRGSVENINGLLRFFFPHGMDLRLVTQELLSRVENLLNARPRKCLGWLAPAELFSFCCT